MFSPPSSTPQLEGLILFHFLLKSLSCTVISSRKTMQVIISYILLFIFFVIFTVLNFHASFLTFSSPSSQIIRTHTQHIHRNAIHVGVYYILYLLYTSVIIHYVISILYYIVLHNYKHIYYTKDLLCV